MVTQPASSSEGPVPEPNRAIVVVTGANAGLGLSICHRLLSSLSTPIDEPIPETIPQRSALSPALASQHLDLDLPGPSSQRESFTLTLILACRSLKKAQAAKEELLETHLAQVSAWKGKGKQVSEAWTGGLRIEIELLDVDSPTGENGILQFCERLKLKYPHITTLFSNAGVHAGIRQHWGRMCLEVLRKGPFLAWSNDKAFMEEEVGRLSGDKQRGAIWGINTFATYLLANELLPLLQKSPNHLPFSPRVVYTTSSTAELSDFDLFDPSDTQMRTYGRVYAPSKYAADLLINDFDRVHGADKAERPVRAFTVEPGCTVTSAGRAHIIDKPWAGFVLFANWLTFYLLRLLGSPYHPRDTIDATASLLYAALVPDEYLPRPGDTERFKFGVHSHPFRDATTDYKTIEGGDTPQAEGILKAQLAECERLRGEYRRKEGLD